jgi:hypothetical protein
VSACSQLGKRSPFTSPRLEKTTDQWASTLWSLDTYLQPTRGGSALPIKPAWPAGPCDRLIRSAGQEAHILRDVTFPAYSSQTFANCVVHHPDHPDPGPHHQRHHKHLSHTDFTKERGDESHTYRSLDGSEEGERAVAWYYLCHFCRSPRKYTELLVAGGIQAGSNRFCISLGLSGQEGAESSDQNVPLSFPTRPRRGADILNVVLEWVAKRSEL